MATSTPDLPPALAAGLRAAVRGVSGLYRAAACSVAVLTPDGDRLRFVAAHGEGEAQITGVTLDRSTGIAGWVVSSGTALAVADVRRDPRFAARRRRRRGTSRQRSWPHRCSRDDGEVIGVTEVLDPTVRERDLDLLALVGLLLALPMTQARPRSSALNPAVDAVGALGPDAEELAVALLRAVATHQGRRR